MDNQVYIQITSSHFIRNEPASLARAMRVVMHFIFALGPSALGMGESYF